MIAGYFEKLKQDLILSELINSFKIIREVYGCKDGFIRIKCQLPGGYMLEFSEYVQLTSSRQLKRESYSFHWQQQDGKLLKRWDNAPHHPEITTFPDHF